MPAAMRALFPTNLFQSVLADLTVFQGSGPKRSIMKSHRHLLLNLAFMTLLYALACRKEAGSPDSRDDTLPYEAAATATVTFNLGAPFVSTKLVSPSEESEKQCNRWALWLFDADGDSAVYGTGLSGEAIRKTVLVGTYTAVAVVNYPSSLVPENIRKKTDITEWITSLSDNAPGSFLMYGEKTLTLEKDKTLSNTVDVRRLVSKIGVKKISVNFENPYLASKNATLEAIYLTNLYRTSRLKADYGAEELSGASRDWYNPMGWHLSGETDAATDALTGELNIHAVLTPASPHTNAHYFYAYPNAFEAAGDTHDATWSKRSSRLVLQVSIGGKTYYYQIQIPAMERNKVYVAEEVILKKLGSMDPEQDIPGSLDVVFSAFGNDWDENVSIYENS